LYILIRLSIFSVFNLIGINLRDQDIDWCNIFTRKRKIDIFFFFEIYIYFFFFEIDWLIDYDWLVGQYFDSNVDAIPSDRVSGIGLVSKNSDFLIDWNDWLILIDWFQNNILIIDWLIDWYDWFGWLVFWFQCWCYTIRSGEWCRVGFKEIWLIDSRWLLIDWLID